MNLSIEDQFLIQALRYPRDDRWKQKITHLCTPSLNWPTIIQRAEAVGLVPMLYRQLSPVYEDLKLPGDGLIVLKSDYLRNLAKNTYRGIELQRILNAFKDKGLAVLLLKGAALAEGVYHDPGARIYGDLDILVKKVDLERARDVLVRLDYQSEETADTQKHYREHHHHLAPMIHPETSVVVELHWNVNPRIHVDIDAWWERSAAIELCNNPVRVLGATDTVLHLCLHLFSSGETRNSLRGIYDIYRALQYAGKSMDWALFKAEVQRYGLRDEVWAVIQTTRQIMDPQGKQIAWPEIQSARASLVAQMERIVFSMDHRHPFPGSLVAIQAEKQWMKKIAWLWRRFFPHPTEMASRYGFTKSSWKVYLCYLFRPLELFWRYGRHTRHFLSPK